MSSSPYTVCFYCADQNPHRDRSRGITQYTYGLMSHLRDSPELTLKAMVSKSSFPVPTGISQIIFPLRTDRLLARLAADQLHPLFGSRGSAEVWHYPKGFIPFGPQVRAKK